MFEPRPRSLCWVRGLFTPTELLSTKNKWLSTDFQENPKKALERIAFDRLASLPGGEATLPKSIGDKETGISLCLRSHLSCGNNLFIIPFAADQWRIQEGGEGASGGSGSPQMHSSIFY